MHASDRTRTQPEPDTNDQAEKDHSGKDHAAQEPEGKEEARTPDERTPARDAQVDRGKDPKHGFDREVGAFDDPDAQDDDEALPGRAGGGLAGG